MFQIPHGRRSWSPLILVFFLPIFNSYFRRTSVDSMASSVHKAAATNQQPQKKTNLWLTTCDTRYHSKSLNMWKYTANFVKILSTRDEDKSHVVSINLKNFCQGTKWTGFWDKRKMLINFAKTLIHQSQDQTSSGNNNYTETTVLLYTDSDSAFNPWAGYARQVIERYDQVRKGKPVLISAEPNCYIGSHCSAEQLKHLYPDALPRSNCPQFLNSGQVMGEPEHLVKLLEFPDSMKQEDLKLGKKQSDQGLLTNAYSHNRHLAELDIGSVVFRNTVFGFVDASAEAKQNCGRKCVWSCGAGAAKDCGVFKKPIIGFLNTTTKDCPFIQMDQVPGCVSAGGPSSIHSPGGKEMKVPTTKLIGDLVSSLKKNQ